jgi:hypothetical protein
MSSKQRVFSHENTTNYIEYLKNKNAVEALKTIKNSDVEHMLTRYQSYDQKINYSKSYYKYAYFDCEPCHPYEKPDIPCDCPKLLEKKSAKIISQLNKNCYNQPTVNINQSNISYKKMETMNDPCKRCIEGICSPCNDCNLKNHRLYPYATFKDRKKETPRLTKSLDLNCWDPCPKKCPKPFDLLNIGYDCGFKFKKNGKLVKPLFIN